MKLKELAKWAKEKEIYLNKVSPEENITCSWGEGLVWSTETCFQDAHYFVEGDFYCGTHTRIILLEMRTELS